MNSASLAKTAEFYQFDVSIFDISKKGIQVPVINEVVWAGTPEKSETDNYAYRR